MKFAKMRCIAAVGLFTLLTLPIQLAAQGNQNNGAPPPSLPVY
jgi:hypothetical protein